jgi:hypothetical protein
MMRWFTGKSALMRGNWTKTKASPREIPSEIIRNTQAAEHAPKRLPKTEKIAAAADRVN